MAGVEDDDGNKEKFFSDDMHGIGPSVTLAAYGLSLERYQFYTRHACRAHKRWKEAKSQRQAAREAVKSASSRAERQELRRAGDDPGEDPFSEDEDGDPGEGPYDGIEDIDHGWVMTEMS